MPSLIRRVHEAKPEGPGGVVIWGTGSPKREVLHLDAMVEASFILLKLTT